MHFFINFHTSEHAGSNLEKGSHAEYTPNIYHKPDIVILTVGISHDFKKIHIYVCLTFQITENKRGHRLIYLRYNL